MSDFLDFDVSLERGKVIRPPALCYLWILNIYLIMYWYWWHSTQDLKNGSLLVFSSLYKAL